MVDIYMPVVECGSVPFFAVVVHNLYNDGEITSLLEA
jgi:hypothetical protein